MLASAPPPASRAPKSGTRLSRPPAPLSKPLPFPSKPPNSPPAPPTSPPVRPPRPPPSDRESPPPDPPPTAFGSFLVVNAFRMRPYQRSFLRSALRPNMANMPRPSGLTASLISRAAAMVGSSCSAPPSLDEMFVSAPVSLSESPAPTARSGAPVAAPARPAPRNRPRPSRPAGETVAGRCPPVTDVLVDALVLPRAVSMWACSAVAPVRSPRPRGCTVVPMGRGVPFPRT